MKKLRPNKVSGLSNTAHHSPGLFRFQICYSSAFSSFKCLQTIRNHWKEYCQYSEEILDFCRRCWSFNSLNLSFFTYLSFTLYWVWWGGCKQSMYSRPSISTDWTNCRPKIFRGGKNKKYQYSNKKCKLKNNRTTIYVAFTYWVL